MEIRHSFNIAADHQFEYLAFFGRLGHCHAFQNQHWQLSQKENQTPNEHSARHKVNKP
jgi:hypothetical protein